MAKKKIDFETVRAIARLLPDVEDGTAYGSPALKVRGQMFACVPVHRSAEPNSLALRIDFEQRDELIAAEPDIYYAPEHYVNYPCVLVRLSRVHADALKDLVGMACRYVAARARRKKTPSVRRARR